MTKADFTDEIAQALGVPKREAEGILEIILGGMVRALHRGERIEIRGFGTFGTHVRSARNGRNPRNGVHVKVPTKRVPHFRASKALKELVNSRQALKSEGCQEGRR